MTTTSSPKRSPFAVPLVLGLLDLQPQHGYALFSQVQADLQDVWHVGMNRLYALLEEMERAGLIKGHAERDSLRPTRRVFHITPKGKRRFELWVHAPSPSMREMRVDFLPKLYFACRRGPQDVAQLVQGQRGACQNELARMSARQKEVGEGDAYRALIYDFRVRQIQAILEWLDACEARLVADHTEKRAAHSSRKPKRKAA